MLGNDLFGGWCPEIPNSDDLENGSYLDRSAEKLVLRNKRSFVRGIAGQILGVECSVFWHTAEHVHKILHHTIGPCTQGSLRLLKTNL